MLDRLTLTTFAAALLLSAGLLFNIQPMVGKMLLPLVGGTPAVWNVAMAFFQLSLLAGYFIAHILGRLPAALHALAYVAALLLACLFLPVALPPDWRPDPMGYPPFQVLSVLITSIAIPFIALSLSAPTLQRLFSGTRHEHATDPYFLYVASNLGSFIGLLIYPLLLEREYSVGAQTHLWQLAFYALVGLAALCLLVQLAHPVKAGTANARTSASAAPGWRQRGWWVLLAFIPSSLTLGVTTHITTDVSPTPMLWVVTLGLYLLTFIIAFARRGEALRQFNLNFFHWAGCLTIAAFVVPIQLPWQIIALNLAGFFMTALACHTLLARNRPGADRLTEFYFWLSVGGALGGSFNAFLAPIIFNQLYEYPLVLMTGLLVFMPATNLLDHPKKRQIALVTMIVVIIAVIVAAMMEWLQSENMMRFLLIAFVSISLLLLRSKRWTFGLAGYSLILAITLSGIYHDRIFIARDFFGIVSVQRAHNEESGVDYLVLNHGNTTHGMQIIKPQPVPIPTAYYSPSSPTSDIFRKLMPKTVAIIGLGSGGLNCYARPGQSFHFFEIDPLVEQVARKYFTFLSDCPPARVTIGDGRLELARDPDHYDAIFIDAFSSDSIPVQIITREAIQVYLDHLNPGGVILVHVSNRFFELEPMLAALARDMGLTALRGAGLINRFEPDMIHLLSEWILLTPTPASADRILADAPPAPTGEPDPLRLWDPRTERPAWRAARTRDGIEGWTDDHSNLLSVLKWEPVLGQLTAPKQIP